MFLSPSNRPRDVETDSGAFNNSVPPAEGLPDPQILLVPQKPFPARGPPRVTPHLCRRVHSRHDPWAERPGTTPTPGETVQGASLDDE